MGRLKFYKMWKIKRVSFANLQKVMNKYCVQEWQVEDVKVSGKKFVILFYRYSD